LRLAKHYTENSEAYQAYLKGRYFLSKWTRSDFERAITYFEQAIKSDLNYAPAYSGLADAHNLLGYLGYAPPREAFPRSETAARQALKLDAALSEAHLALAKIKFFYDWNWAGAEEGIKRALELNPNYPDAHSFYGAYLTAMGRFDEALAARQRGLELDPLSPLATTMVGWVYFYQRQYDQAIDWYRRALELDSHFLQAQEDVGLSYYLKGAKDQAIAEILKAKTLSGVRPEIVAALKLAFDKSGRAGYWRKELELAEERLKQGKVSPWRMARIYAELGDKDQAFAWLDKANEERNGLIPFLKVTPIFESLHTDPRFADLLRRIGLEP
jgi:tetratricopeptide (TPR) repeat protein